MSNKTVSDNIPELTFSQMKELRSKKSEGILTKEEGAQLEKYYLQAAYVASGEMSDDDLPEQEESGEMSDDDLPEQEESRGKCCFCNEECNPSSQSCGRCARAATGYSLGWMPY